MAPRFRIDGISLKQFYQMTSTERKDYIQQILELKEHERSDVDIYILKFFHNQQEDKINFFKIAH